MRYAFPSSIAAYVVWVVLIQASNLRRTWKAGLVVLLAPVLEQALSTGCPSPVSGPIYPDPWIFHDESPGRPMCPAH
jgi:hypothetical protein